MSKRIQYQKLKTALTDTMVNGKQINSAYAVVDAQYNLKQIVIKLNGKLLHIDCNFKRIAKILNTL